MAIPHVAVVAGGWGLGLGLVAGGATILSKGARPLLKGTVAGYLVLSERARELAAQSVGEIHDLYEQARAEYHESARQDGDSARR
jgi:hypothetical protein